MTPKQRLGPAVLACLGAIQICCGSVYQPSGERSPQVGRNVAAHISAIRQHAAVVSIDATSEATIAVPRLALSSETGCQAGTQLSWAGDTARGGRDTRSLSLAGARDLAVRLGNHDELLRKGLVLDLPIQVGSEEECLRLPLTAQDDEVLWRLTDRHWDAGLGLRLEYPTAAIAGVGAGLTMEGRFVRPMGSFRPSIAVDFGLAMCWQACPSLEGAKNGLDGLFTHFGVVLGVDYRIPLGGWALDLGPGLSTTLFILAVGNDTREGRTSAQWGARGSLRLLTPTQAVPGFAPPDRFVSGPELLVERRFGNGHGGADAAYVIGVGWNWSFEGPL